MAENLPLVPQAVPENISRYVDPVKLALAVNTVERYQRQIDVLQQLIDHFTAPVIAALDEAPNFVSWHVLKELPEHSRTYETIFNNVHGRIASNRPAVEEY